MANNRLYILDRDTGERFYFAKSDDPASWKLQFNQESLQRWLEGRDLAALEDDDAAVTRLQLVDEHGDEG
jgi:hypothetical protein